MKIRPRRLRGSAVLRKMVAETSISPDQLVQPAFIIHGKGIREEITSMPGQFRFSVDTIGNEAKEIKKKITYVTSIAERIYTLECNKKVCVVNQDYETSKDIKLEIEKLKLQIIGMAKSDKLLSNNMLNNSLNNKSIDFDDESKLFREKMNNNNNNDADL